MKLRGKGETGKKHYHRPVIIAVTLDPEQAVLASCKVGGLYFSGPSGPGELKCVFGTDPTTGAQCNTQARLSKTGNVPNNMSAMFPAS